MRTLVWMESASMQMSSSSSSTSTTFSSSFSSPLGCCDALQKDTRCHSKNHGINFQGQYEVQPKLFDGTCRQYNTIQPYNPLSPYIPVAIVLVLCSLHSFVMLDTRNFNNDNSIRWINVTFWHRSAIVRQIGVFYAVLEHIYAL